jgi:hypothetical protein
VAVRSDQRTWVRKLDGDMHVVAQQPQLRLYPADFDEVRQCFSQISNPPLGAIPQARTIGSHWATSGTGVTGGYMLETATPVHEPDGDQAAPRLNRVLYDVVPNCLTAEALRFFQGQTVSAFNPAVKYGPPWGPDPIYLFHVEAGMRIYELYSALDGFLGPGLDPGSPSLPESLAGEMHSRRGNDDYQGPWALETMGGAGGQTIAGVISTATHGGDLAFGAISDAVVAMHLIGADGEHHWIERTQLRPTMLPLKLVDESKLKQLYNHPEIHYHRDNDLMNAAVVACGRMGMIYSLVLRVVRQYALHEHCVEDDWENVKQWVTDPTNPVFDANQNRFARIDVNVYGGFWDPSRRRCYVITRTMHELDHAGSDPLGREQRAGENAGKKSQLGKGNGAFDNPCASDNWIRDAINEIQDSFEDIRDDAIKGWLVCAAIIAFPLTPPPIRAAALAAQVAFTATIVAMQALILQLELLEALLPGTVYFGDTLADIANACAQLGIFPIFGEIYERASAGEHGYDPETPKTPAISYAAMDEHDYLNVGCVAPADTIEFFVDADSPELPNFIDHVLGRVIDLQVGALTNGQPAAFGGYVSLRFMTQSQALLAMQRWPRTCSIEIAGLSRVLGTDPLLQTLEEDAKQFDVVLHWGQRNGWPMREIEKRFGSTAPTAPLYKWRKALSDLSEHGRYAAFSTDFSKHKGLEVTTPIVETFSVSPTEGCPGELATITWDAISNPPETQAFLVQTPAVGTPTRTPLGALEGTRQWPLPTGRATLSLLLERELNGEIFTDKRDLDVHGFTADEPWQFMFVTSPRTVDGVTRWAAEINLFSQFISNNLRVSAVRCSFPGVASWRVRNEDTGDLQFDSTNDRIELPSPGRPVFNTNWLFYSDAPVAPGPAPTLTVDFTLTCEL